jgi:hypothetical protein
MDSWKLRDELLVSLSQWYLILAFILVGGLLGFGISYLVPAPYQAVKDIYLGIDVSRVNEMEYIIPLAEEEPLNLDDYKNWQLKQAADILKSDQVLRATLDLLRASDALWENVSLQDFRKAVDIYWYDAGSWRMEVVQSEQDQAVAAVEAWVKTGHKRISDLLQISLSGFDLDQEIWTINLALGDQKRQRAKLATFISSGGERIAELEKKEGQELIEGSDYDQLTSWLFVYQSESPYWEDLLSPVPNKNQTYQVFNQWLHEVVGEAEIALEEVSLQQAYLQAEKDQILPEYHQNLNDSLGLSSNIVLLPNSSGTEVQRIYSSDTATIGGAFLGFLAWAIFVIVRIKPDREDHGK